MMVKGEQGIRADVNIPNLQKCCFFWDLIKKS